MKVLVVLLIATFAVAANIATSLLELPTDGPGINSYFHTARTSDGWAWLSVPWTDSNAPYKAIRSQIDEQLNSGGSARNLYLAARQNALACPSDAQAQFRWAYAAWRLLPTLRAPDEPLPVLNGIVENMAALPLPRAYDYIRIRYLIQSWEGPESRMEPLAVRLIKADPTDRDVRYQYVCDIIQGPSIDKISSIALPLAEALLRENPNDPKNYDLLAGVYNAICHTTHIYQPYNVDRSIYYFTQYSQRIPYDKYEQHRVSKIIAWLQKKEAEQPQ